MNPIAANVNKATADSTAIISAVANKVIRITGLQLIAAADVTVTIEDSDGTAMIGPMALAANGGFVFPPLHDASGHLWYQRAASGKAVHLKLSAAVQVGGSVQYTVRDQ